MATERITATGLTTLLCAIALCPAACARVSSDSAICDAPSPVAGLRPRLTTLREEGDYQGMVALLQTVPTPARDECWFGSISGALTDAWDLPRAEQELKTGLKAFHESSHLTLALANTYGAMGRLGESETLLRRALADQPTLYMKNWLRDGLARMYREKGDYRAAKATWDQLIRENPSDVSFILNSMTAEAPLGHYEIASERNDRAVLLGVSEYGRSVGMSNLAFAAYYGGENAEAIRNVDALIPQAEPLFSEEIAELALMLDYRVQAARDRIETRHRGALSLPVQVAEAGLQAKLGDRSQLDDLLSQRPSDEPGIRVGLVDALLAVKDPAAVDMAQSLVDSVPDHPLYRYLLGRALRDSNEPGWEQHAQAAVDACPDNVVFQQASTP